MLQSMGSQRVRHDWATEQQQTETEHISLWYKKLIMTRFYFHLVWFLSCLSLLEVN